MDSHPIIGNLWPDVSQAAELKNISDKKVLSSIRYLLSVVQKSEVCDTSSLQERISKILSEGWSTDFRVTSMVYILHTILKQSVADQNIDGATGAFSELSSTSFLTNEITCGPLGGSQWTVRQNDLIVRALDQSSVTTYGKTMGIIRPNLERSEAMRIATQKAFEMLRRLDFPLYCDTRASVTDLVYFQSEQTTSGSSFNFLGLISMNSIQENQNWTTVLEMIIHESAHQIVYNAMVVETLIRNEGEGRFKSSLRSDLRPLSGIFHALIVVSRMIYVMSSLSDSGILENEGVKIVPARNNANNDDPYHEKYYALLEVIEKNAELSPLGWRMVESSKQLAALKIPSRAY